MLIPLQCGGPPDEAEKAYAVLRSAEGKGGSAPDDSGIDGLWRRSIALGLDAGSSATRRAYFNAFPNLATDLLRHYQRTLVLVMSSDSSDADKREAIADLWSATASATIPELNAELLKIDPRLTVESTPEAQTTSSMGGRWFAELTGSGEAPAFNNSSSCSALAAPTTRYRVTAFLAVDNEAALTKQDERSFESARRRLRALVPSWVGFNVSVASTGFLAGVSPLGMAVV